MSDNINEQIAYLKEQIAQLEKEATEKENNTVSATFASINSEHDFNTIPNKSISISKLIAGGITAFIFFIFLVASENNSSKNNKQIGASNDVSGRFLGSDDTPATDATNVIKAVEAEEKAKKMANDTTNEASSWEYNSFTDGMNDTATKLACVESVDEIFQSFPYETTHTELCIRKSPKQNLDVFFRLKSEGQILCHSYSEPCVIKVRFDNGAVQSFSGLNASDNSSEIVFFQNSQRMLNSVLKSKQTRVQVELYQNGSQTTTFNTSSLIWPPK